MLTESVRDDYLSTRIRNFTPSQIETQPVTRGNRLFDVGH
jgi:hypothetical protein